MGYRLTLTDGSVGILLLPRIVLAWIADLRAVFRTLAVLSYDREHPFVYRRVLISLSLRDEHHCRTKTQITPRIYISEQHKIHAIEVMPTTELVTTLQKWTPLSQDDPAVLRQLENINGDNSPHLCDALPNHPGDLDHGEKTPQLWSFAFRGARNVPIRRTTFDGHEVHQNQHHHNHDHC